MSKCDLDTSTLGYALVAVSFDKVQKLWFSRQVKKIF
jgi:hypothetical protein